MPPASSPFSLALKTIDIRKLLAGVASSDSKPRKPKPRREGRLSQVCLGVGSFVDIPQFECIPSTPKNSSTDPVERIRIQPSIYPRREPMAGAANSAWFTEGSQEWVDGESVTFASPYGEMS